jgi:hypothetical protein
MNYGEAIDTAILALLCVWAVMDRCNFYFRSPK